MTELDLNNPFMPVFGVGENLPPQRAEAGSTKAQSSHADTAPITRTSAATSASSRSVASDAGYGATGGAGVGLFQAPLFQAPPQLDWEDDDAIELTSRKRKKRDSESSDKKASRKRKKQETNDEAADATRGRARKQRERAEVAAQEQHDIDENAEDEALTAPLDDFVDDDIDEDAGESSSRRRRRRRRPARSTEPESSGDVMEQVTALKGSTRLEAKRIRRREGRRRDQRRPALITEAEFLARRESVDRKMIVRERDGLNQIAVLEDGMLVEHFVARHSQATQVGSIYLGRVQNVLPSMEAAFVDLGSGRNAVLYAGEVDWRAAGLKAGKPRKIEAVLSPGDPVLVQVTKDPIGHKGARLTSQVTLAGRYLVLVPNGGVTGISRKLPEKERRRLKKALREIVPKGHGVIVRTAAEGATEEQLQKDVERLLQQWEQVQKDSQNSKNAPKLLHGEPELALRVVRDLFNEDFNQLIVQGNNSWKSISDYVAQMAPDLLERCEHWVKQEDVFEAHRIDEQLAKGMDRKVWLPSGGYLIIDRTEAMTVIDVNTGKYTGGGGGTLEETVTRNNLESAEEIARQLRLRDIGGIVVIDFVDMVLEANRDLVLRRLVECLARDRTRHQVTEVTSLGLVQMTRKRVGQGLVEAFSTPCECCEGRGFIVHRDPVERNEQGQVVNGKRAKRAEDNAVRNRKRRGEKSQAEGAGEQHVREGVNQVTETKAEVRSTLAAIARAGRHDEAESDAANTQTPANGGEESATDALAVASGSDDQQEQNVLLLADGEDNATSTGKNAEGNTKANNKKAGKEKKKSQKERRKKRKGRQQPDDQAIEQVKELLSAELEHKSERKHRRAVATGSAVDIAHTIELVTERANAKQTARKEKRDQQANNAIKTPVAAKAKENGAAAGKSHGSQRRAVSSAPTEFAPKAQAMIVLSEETKHKSLSVPAVQIAGPRVGNSESLEPAETPRKRRRRATGSGVIDPQQV